MSSELTVIIPCYNEARRLTRFFDLIEKNLSLPWEWLFVDDGSQDNTSASITHFRQLAPDRITLLAFPNNTGKGKAVREGMRQARGELVGYVDADLAASPLHFQQFIDNEALCHGKELIIGIRVKTQDGQVHRLFYRHIIGRVFQTYTSAVTGLTVYDTQCGFKILAAKQAQKIATQMTCDGFAFDVELILLALKCGMVVREQMIPWQEQGDSRIRPRHILQMGRDIIRISRRVKRLPPLN